MRVAQLTIDVYDNYGNILQKYALHRILKNFVEFTEVLWLKDGNFFHDMGTWMSHHPKVSSNDDGQRQRHYFYEAARTLKFKEFENRYIRTRFDLPYLEDIADEYDYFVVGSDQVWNPTFILSEFPGMFLEYVPREKRIAYAASIAAPIIPDRLKEFFRAGISGFDHVSVREEGAVKIIKELTGKDALLVLDPTMLLSQWEWLEVAQKPSWFDERYANGYILSLYLVQSPPPEVQATAKSLELPVINLFDYDNYWHYVVGPEEFLYLFANASLVYTDSYHGVIFSIIFKKAFVNRAQDELARGHMMSMRIPSLLKMFGLENRSADPFEMDFSTRDKILPAERKKSLNFLRNSLGLEMGGGGSA